MTLTNLCAHTDHKRHGKDRNGNQRFRCKNCGETWLEARVKPLGDMRIDMKTAVLALRLLVEGNSVRTIERLTGLHRDTICDLLLVAGRNCKRFMEATIKNVIVSDVECDELWSFVYCKDRTRRRLSLSTVEHGDQYCFVGFERHTKLILAWQLGCRDADNGRQFVLKLAEATAQVPYQLTTDGWSPYKHLIPGWLRRHRVDFAMLIKIYAQQSAEAGRYSPPQIIETKRKAVTGNPDLKMACTSHVERQNLTIRMGLRRFTRLTNAFSKKLENHEAALGLYFAYYNWCRVHGTIKTTPAVASKLTDHVWTVEELLTKAAGY